MQADKEGENLSVTEREFNSESIGKKRFKNDIKKILIVLLFLALLVWQFSSMELFFKKTITDFDIGIIIKNIALFGVVNVILTGLFHRMKPAFMITYVCTMLIGVVNYFVISFYKINYQKVKNLLEFLEINLVSIFHDEYRKYIFDNYISLDNFVDYMKKFDDSSIIFDGKIDFCQIDKEIDTLKDKKVLVSIDVFEKLTYIIINKNKTFITKKNIKEILKKVK